MFEQLTELKLNGNAIEKLEHLDKLKNLRELNVSHNRIQKLEGLDTLTRLETLVVHHNEIARLEGLDELRELRLLSIGHNKLASRDDVLYLRRVKSLRALSLEGNPVCQIPGHEEFTSVLLPELRYLDYKLVKSPQQISIELRAVLIRVEEIEAIEAEAALASETEKRRLEVLKDAFVDELEVDDLVCVPGLHWASVLEVGGEVALAMVQEHSEQMQKVCTSLQQLGLHQRTLRQAEEREFAACWKLACDTNRHNSMR
ncbi:hypothetical protein B566_EDAN014074 [Ephemera danica]|nr:hypothetical protein B566_EDAN014074 [Ephemera danica]